MQKVLFVGLLAVVAACSHPAGVTNCPDISRPALSIIPLDASNDAPVREKGSPCY